MPNYTKKELESIENVLLDNGIMGAIVQVVNRLKHTNPNNGIKSLKSLLCKIQKNMIGIWPDSGLFSGCGVIYRDYEVIYVPLRNVPLYVNNTFSSVKLISKWRLSHGK